MSRRNNLPGDTQTPDSATPKHYETLAGKEAFANTLSPPSPMTPTRASASIPGGELQMGKGAKSPSV